MRNRLRRPYFTRFFCLVFMVAGAFFAASAYSTPISVEQHLRRAEFTGMSISPDGKRLAALLPHKDRRNLAVIDLEKRTRSVITAFDTYDVIDFSWINNERLFLRVGYLETTLSRQEYKGTYAVDWDGGNLRNLSEIQGRYVSISPLRRIAEDAKGEMLVSMNLRRRDGSDVYRLNTKNGRAEILSFDAPANTGGWTLDAANVPRLATTADRQGNGGLWYRSDEKSPWRQLRTWNESDAAAETIEPVQFEWGKSTVLVSSNVGRDTAALMRFDPEQNKLLDVVAEHPWLDITAADVILAPKDRSLAGVRVDAEKPSTVWVTPERTDLQKLIDAALPGRYNSYSTDYEGKFALVQSWSDTDRGQTFLLNIEKKSLEDLPAFAPWLKIDNFGERRFLWVTARDGIKFPAWLSLPPGSNGKNLPLIVHIHGGPVLRAYDYRADAETLFLASRGYAVLTPEPRGGTGFGRELTRLGQKQWGRAMQDDITDAALQLVKEGVADRSKMCLYEIGRAHV